MSKRLGLVLNGGAGFIPASGQIRAGASFALALKSDGTVSAWGLNSNGQLGDATTTTRTTPVTISGLTNVAGLAAGFNHQDSAFSSSALLGRDASWHGSPDPWFDSS